VESATEKNRNQAWDQIEAAQGRSVSLISPGPCTATGSRDLAWKTDSECWSWEDSDSVFGLGHQAIGAGVLSGKIIRAPKIVFREDQTNPGCGSGRVRGLRIRSPRDAVTIR